MADLNLTDWDQDLEADSQEEYQALVKTLQWTEAFGLLFVRCAPSDEEDFILRIKNDVPEKRTEVLSFDAPIINFYESVEALPNKDEIDILFISGLAKSIIEYNQPGYGSEGNYYSLSSIPKVLSHLNLHRERFRDDFKICFVFLLPLFALKYFIRRAPDFFDWNSGVWEFTIIPERLQEHAKRLKGDRNHWSNYENLTTQECLSMVIEIQELIDSSSQSSEPRASLFFEKALVLDVLGKYELAIESYDKALELLPQSHQAWYNRGVDLFFLGQYEEAIESFEQALAIDPEKCEAWNSKGIALRRIKRFDEAIESYQKSVECNPDFYEAWYNLGVTNSMLENHQQALESYQKALSIKQDYPEALYNSACAYAQVGQYDLAIQQLKQAIALKPDKYRDLAVQEQDFASIREDKKFQEILAN